MMRGREDNLQIGCVTWMQYQHPHEAMMLHHSPNGGWRDAREAAKFKAMGTRAGFPDLFLAIPSHGYHGLFVELKTDKGRQSESQKEWETMLTLYGYKYVLIRDLGTFRKTINDYLNISYDKL